MKKILGMLAVGLMLSGVVNTASATATSQTYSLSFEACLAKKESVITQLGINPRDIVPVVNTIIMTLSTYVKSKYLINAIFSPNKIYLYKFLHGKKNAPLV